MLEAAIVLQAVLGAYLEAGVIAALVLAATAGFAVVLDLLKRRVFAWIGIGERPASALAPALAPAPALPRRCPWGGERRRRAGGGRRSTSRHARGRGILTGKHQAGGRP